MFSDWQTGLLAFFHTTSQILTAGVAIMAFSLTLYALTFNLKDRVARSFALVLGCITVIFSAEAIGSTASAAPDMEFWLRLEWLGIIPLPMTYMTLSDALLQVTGSTGNGRRRFLRLLVYSVTFLLLAGLPFPTFFRAVVLERQPAVYLQTSPLTIAFTLFYLAVMGLSWAWFMQAFWRTRTPTSRRRMAYLVGGALAPALGSFPYLMFGAGFAGKHQITFWLLVLLGNLGVIAGMVVMAYTVAFFGVPWSDRLVRTRLFKWIIRGPMIASLLLGVTTVVRRLGDLYGITYSALVPIAMLLTVLFSQFALTLLGQVWERWLFSGKERDDLVLIRQLENRLLTQNDLHQFMELILAAVCDRLQARGAYVVSLSSGDPETVVALGEHVLDGDEISVNISRVISQKGDIYELFRWGDDLVVPLLSDDPLDQGDLIGLLGISQMGDRVLQDEQSEALNRLARRAMIALKDQRRQRLVFQSLQNLTPEMGWVQQMRAQSQFNGKEILEADIPEAPPQEMVLSVRDALTHYWGGPKLTGSPLMALQVVQDALHEHDGNRTNALRAILRQAIERTRPQGEETRRFTAEWILYNILDMKFVEGRKVREIALRLAMSEADLYRKQRVAIEAVAKMILEMETQARSENDVQLD